MDGVSDDVHQIDDPAALCYTCGLVPERLRGAGPMELRASFDPQAKDPKHSVILHCDEPDCPGMEATLSRWS